MALVRYKGRKVSAHWYRTYVLGAASRTIAVQRTLRDTTRYVMIHLPAIPCAKEKAETRAVGFRSNRDRRWLEDIAADYAASFADGIVSGLVTLFPNHPNLDRQGCQPATPSRQDSTPRPPEDGPAASRGAGARSSNPVPVL